VKNLTARVLLHYIHIKAKEASKITHNEIVNTHLVANELELFSCYVDFPAISG